MNGPPEIKKPEPVVDVPKLLALLKTWTQCEVQGRLGEWPRSDLAICWPHRQVEIEDEIRVLLYGSSDLIVLAHKWRIIR